MKTAYENSYWNNNGTHEDIAKELRKLIPQSGECPDAKGKNRKLDLFRRAANCYYDLFNNGLFNRATEFRAVFGFSPKKIFMRSINGRWSIDYQSEEMNVRLNQAMDGIIIAAAFEQGLKLNITLAK